MVAVKHADVAAGYYFWGLVRGAYNAISSATLPKGTIVTVGTDGALATHVAGSFGTGVVIGKMLENASGGTASAAFVRLFG